jgi:putative chitinase
MAVSVGTKKINRDVFYKRVRVSVFNGRLSQSQVNGMEAIFNEWESRGLQDYRYLAYMLATCYHETGHTLQPIEEYDKGGNRAYAKPDPTTGKIYFGRGFVQLTWIKNYKTMGNLLGVDLVNHPEKALDLRIATDILFEGMLKGLFTGRKLSDYFNDKPETKQNPYWLNARRIINGTDRAELIEGYGRTFYAALL